MSRSAWKGFFICKNTKKLLIKSFLKKKRFLSWFFLRNSNLLNTNVGQTFKVHNGKFLKKNKTSVLHQLKKAGEFAFTRKPYFFPLKKKK